MKLSGMMLAGSILLSMGLQTQSCGQPADDPPPIDASQWYLLGVNYPWVNYGGDFGRNAWGQYGVSASSTYAEVDADFAWLAAHGAHVVRWFVFADGRAAPEFAADGSVTGLDSNFLDDFDQAVALARVHNLFLIPVLLDFYWCDTASVVSGVQIGGHADIIRDTSKRQSFIDQALMPMLERYGAEPNVLLWEIINEPEWAMIDSGGWTVGDPVSSSAMQDFVAEVADTIRTNALQQVTLGSAKQTWLVKYWRTAPLDVWQYHYYDAVPFTETATQIDVSGPVFIGEFPTAGTSWTVDQYLDAIYEGGFGGAVPWSLRAEDSATGFAGQVDAFAAWSAAHQSEVAIGGSSPLVR